MTLLLPIRRSTHIIQHIISFSHATTSRQSYECDGTKFEVTHQNLIKWYESAVKRNTCNSEWIFFDLIYFSLFRSLLLIALMISIASSASSLSSNTNLAAIDNGMPSDSTAMLAARDIRRCFDNFVEPSRYPKFSISPTGKCSTFQSLFPPFPIFNSTEAQHFDQINLGDCFFWFFFSFKFSKFSFLSFSHICSLCIVLLSVNNIFSSVLIHHWPMYRLTGSHFYWPNVVGLR